MKKVVLTFCICIAALTGCVTRVYAPVPTAQSAVERLIAVDRAFSFASARTDLVSGISAMFAPDVATPVPGARFSATAAEAVSAMRAVAGNAESRAEWIPTQAGISGDGMHGFTLGYLDVHRADGSVVPMKYLAYWVKGAPGWRVVAYRRRPRAAGDVSLAMQPALVPADMVAVSTNRKRTESFRASLDAAERSFSRDAQSIGLNAAFARWGTPASYNMGGPADAAFVVGSEAIGRAVSAGEPATGSSVSWAPDRVIIASSGDLGVTIGTIHPNDPSPGGSQAAGFPFFTVWMRANTSAPWRYIAE
jgi:hypothetical protein